MTQYAGFSVANVGDLNNTLQDVSGYTPKADIPEDYGLVTVTTLVAGGGQPTTKQIHGAVKSPVILTVFIDLFTIGIYEQIIGLRKGVTLQLKPGRNASPQLGDKLFQGTFTLFACTPTIETNDKPAKMTWTFKPSDVGNTGIVPAWYPY